MEKIFVVLENKIFEAVNSALLESRRTMADSAWAAIENGKLPFSYNRIPTGDNYRDFCKRLSSVTGVNITYEGLTTISSDYNKDAQNISNYRSTERNANQFHTIIIHQKHSSSFNPYSNFNTDASGEYYDMAKLVLKRFGFKHLQDVNGKEEWKYVYGRATNATFTDDFTDRMNPDFYNRYLEALDVTLHNKEMQESIQEYFINKL